MKKILFFPLAAVLALSGCDYVSNPYPDVNANVGDTASCPTPVFPTVTVHLKKILLEDFTGHTCGNCPGAAAKLHELDTTYPGRIIGLAEHVGATFASPNPGYNGSPSSAFTADYRTTVGENYDGVFGAESFGLPEGMFNRKDFNSTTQTHLKQVPNWSAYAASIMGEPSVVDLQLVVDCDTNTRKVCFAVRDSFLVNMPGTYKLVGLIAQDSIIDWQDVFGTNNATYVHRHMLRDAVTLSGGWGEDLTVAPVAGTTHIRQFAYNVPASYQFGSSPPVPCDIKHCSIIVFIYDTATYEVIQAEEAKLVE